MAPYTLTKLLRRPVLLLFTILFSVILSCFLCFQSDHLDQQRQELGRVHESFDVACVVSSMDGSRTTGLRMQQAYLGFVTDPAYEFIQYVRDLRLTKEFGLKLPDLEGTGIAGGVLVGVNAPECAGVLDESLNGSVVYLTDDFYTSNRPQCIVSEELYGIITGSAEVTAGYVLHAEILDPMYGVTESLPQTLEIAGVYHGAGTEVYIPWSYAESLMHRISDQLSCDSIRFYAADNTKLAELAARAGKAFAAVDILGSETIYSYALTIYDEQYRSTVSTIERSIHQAELLLPFILALCVALGVLVSFLHARNENRDYALMQIVGVTRPQLFVSIMLSRMVPALVGCLISLLATRALIPSLVYLLCYLAGGCAAALRPMRVRPAVILRERE